MNFNSKGYEPRKFVSIKPGEYKFSVLNATEGTSRNSGNEMITLELGVEIPGKDEPVTVFDYLTTWLDKKTGEVVLDKIASFCEATGLMKHFQAGSLDDVVCIGASGRAKFKLEPNGNGNEYLRVHYYLKPEGFSESPRPRPENVARPQQFKEPVNANVPPTDDDIPF